MTRFAEAMPNMLLHEGEWEGIYRHIDLYGGLIDQHRMTTICEFPTDGEFAYIQHNHLRWGGGREQRYRFGGVFRDGLLHWDTERFSGYAWETREGVVMLKLNRRDDPGVSFIEMITLGADGQTRARTWQWFRHGTPFKRTLCDEWRAGSR
jgi:hypothetical protein